MEDILKKITTGILATYIALAPVGVNQAYASQNDQKKEVKVTAPKADEILGTTGPKAPVSPTKAIPYDCKTAKPIEPFIAKTFLWVSVVVLSCAATALVATISIPSLFSITPNAVECRGV